MLETIKLSVYAVTLAFVAHEATHYGIALVLRRRPRFRWVGFDEGAFAVDHDAGEELTVGDYAIHAGPTLIGVVVAFWYLLAVMSVPPLWAVLGWFTYTVVGAPNDLRFREVQTVGS